MLEGKGSQGAGGVELVVDFRRLLVVIPALNPQPELVPLAADLAGAGLQVLVVDDGSGEGATGIFTALAAIDGVRVLQHAINFGKGAALKTAFRELVQLRPLVEVVVTVAADGCHSVGDVVAIAGVAARREAVFVLGVRRGLADMSFGYRLRKRLQELAFWLRTRRRFHDLQTGLRAVPRELVLEALLLRSNGYDFDAALLRRAVSWGGEIIELAIETRFAQGRVDSRFRPWYDSFKVLMALLGPAQNH